MASSESTMADIVILSFDVHDLRFPTSLTASGSDALNLSPDYSAAYLVLHTSSSHPHHTGHGFAFTIGRGNDLVCLAVSQIAKQIQGKSLLDLTKDMGKTWRFLVSDSQLRWVGPEKGVTHLGLAAVVNAIWDLWGRVLEKPVWKLIADMSPEEVVRCIDFRYIQDVITPLEAVEMLSSARAGKEERLADLRANQAVPAYSTEAGWIGYSDEKMTGLIKGMMEKGMDKFKLKVGGSVEDDRRRCRIARELIGDDKMLMLDANQMWNVDQAIDWMLQLVEFKPIFIEEPTSPDDILGHAAIRKALRPHGVGVATGEMCQNRVVFKQLLQAGAIDYCQIDACRLGGVNEVLAVLLMAKKFNVPVVPHSGGIGLTHYTQHLSIIDYLCVSGQKSLLEHISTYNHVLTLPLDVKDGHFVTSWQPGYNVEFRQDALIEFVFPTGTFWQSELGKQIRDAQAVFK